MAVCPPKGEGKLVMTADFVTIFGQLKWVLITAWFYWHPRTNPNFQSQCVQVDRGTIQTPTWGYVGQWSSEDRADVKDHWRGEDEVFYIVINLLGPSLIPCAFLRRAGRLLDVGKEGYYESDKCVSDFKKVIFNDRLLLFVGWPSYIWINHTKIIRLWTLWSLPLGGGTSRCSWSTTPPYTSMKIIKPWYI